METTKMDVDALIASLTLTHTEQRQLDIMTAMQEACDIIGLTEEEHAKFVYGNGLKYLYYFTGDNEIIVEMIEKNPLFWAWWRDWHAVRDKVFVSSYCSSNFGKTKLFNYYLIFNDAQALCLERTPPATVLNP